MWKKEIDFLLRNHWVYLLSILRDHNIFLNKVPSHFLNLKKSSKYGNSIRCEISHRNRKARDSVYNPLLLMRQGTVYFLLLLSVCINNLHTDPFALWNCQTPHTLNTVTKSLSWKLGCTSIYVHIIRNS